MKKLGIARNCRLAWWASKMGRVVSVEIGTVAVRSRRKMEVWVMHRMISTSLTGGTGKPVSDKYPPGTMIGDNGIALRPGNGGKGPRIDIPSNAGKPHETLHY